MYKTIATYCEGSDIKNFEIVFVSKRLFLVFEYKRHGNSLPNKELLSSPMELQAILTAA